MNIHQLLLAARHPAEVHLPIEGELPSLGGATAWLNSPPLAAADLRGRVVLVQFWTYTCINWLRTLPYVRAWAEKYADHGLTEAGGGGTDQELTSVDAGGVKAAADWASLRSPENYLGYERTDNFVSPTGSILDASYAYAAPTRLAL